MATTTVTPATTTIVPTTPISAHRPQYPAGVPEKFSAEGVVQRYPGNTTVCHLPADCPLLPGLHALYETFEAHPMLSQKLHLLPPASWHMTVLDGVRERECEPGMWPPGLDKQPLNESTAQFGKKLRAFGMRLKEEDLAPPYRMRVRCFDEPIVGPGLLVEGATTDEQKRMRRLRDRLADTLGFRAPNHEIYEFHISTGYLLRHMDGPDREEIDRVLAELLPALQMEFELGAVEFCTFENMYEFPRLFYLGQEVEE